MAHKRKGQMTVSGEWARHLRPFWRRAFWKGERQAARAKGRDELIEAIGAEQIFHATVEGLVAELEALPSGATSLDLGVQNQLTLRGEIVCKDIAMAVVLDKALERGLFPREFALHPMGAVYRYAKE
jgi:hypothetical protein